MTDRHKRFGMLLAMVATMALGIVGIVAQSESGDDDGDENGHRVFSFALWGDTPYSETERTTIIPALIQDINASNVAFTVFDGDIKSGSTTCTDAVFANAIDRFNTFDRPMIYVPGDNEWTDCHRINNGSLNALERLAYLRSTMFASPESFGAKKLLLDHQTGYPENTRWIYGDVVFVGLNVPGSNNNKINPGQCVSSKSVRVQTDCDDDNAEYLARDAANIQYLRESVDIATGRQARGLVVVVQADPSFDLPETETDNERTCIRAAQGECLDPPNNTNLNLANYDGYDRFLAELKARTVGFGSIGGQVLFVHGDTHYFKVDKPGFEDATHPLANFTRIGTFGSPNVHWVKVSIDAHGRNLFKIEPMIVQP
jgi:hypothetical protein